MNKKLILLAALLACISVVAMEEIKAMPVLKEASLHEEESLVKIRLTDTQNSETIHEVSIPVRLAKLIGVLVVGLEEPGLLAAGFPLPNVAITIWRLMEPHLERVYRIRQDESQADQLRQEIITEFGKLDVKSLIGVICASDYLAIPILLESACEVLERSAREKISWEELELLPLHIRNQIIMHKVLLFLGPVLGRELVVNRGHHEHPVLSVCVTEDGKIVSGSHDGTIRVWNMDGKLLAVCEGHEDVVESVCVTKDGKIVSGSHDRTVRVWDMQGNQLALCRGHGRGVASVCVRKDGKIVSGSYDNTVRVWDMQGNELAVCRGHEDRVTSVCVTKDGEIVSGSYDNTMRVWDMQGNQLAVYRGHESTVFSVSVTKEGKIVSCSDDKTVRVWDMHGNQLAVCRGHQDMVREVCVTKDGKIVSGSEDNTVRIWDIDANQLAVCRGHKGRVNAVCVTKDGKIVSGSDKTVRVWDIQLLDRIVCMDEDQARAVWAYVRTLSYKLDKQKCWQVVERLLGGDTPVAQTNKFNNNNNE